MIHPSTNGPKIDGWNELIVTTKRNRGANSWKDVSEEANSSLEYDAEHTEMEQAESICECKGLKASEKREESEREQELEYEYD